MEASRTVGDVVGPVAQARFGRSSCTSQDGLYTQRLLHPTIGGAKTVAVVFGPSAGPIEPIGWVICHSFGLEEGFLQPFEVELARRLGAAGSLVIRFHVQGYGDSELPHDAISVQGHIDGAVQAADVLRTETGCASVGFMGVRFGGAVALAAGGTCDAEAAVVVDPVVTGRGYLEPLIRAAVSTDLVQLRRPSEAASIDRSSRADELDVQGFGLRSRVADKLRSFSLVEKLERAPRRVVLVQTSRVPASRPELATLAEHIRAVGAEVETRMIVRGDAWMLGQPRYHSTGHGRKADRQAALSEAILDEMVPAASALGGAAAVPGTVPRVASASDSRFKAASPSSGRASPALWREQAGFVPFGPDHLAAVLTEPIGEPRGLVLLLQGAGGAPRSHRHRLWTSTARALAERGIAAIRFDYRGVGDSTGAFRFELESPPVAEALAILHAGRPIVGDLPVGVVGNCVGGGTALAIAATHPRCVGTVCLLPAVGPVILHHRGGPRSGDPSGATGRNSRAGRTLRRVRKLGERLRPIRFAPAMAEALARGDVLLLEGGPGRGIVRLERSLRTLARRGSVRGHQVHRAEVWPLPTQERSGLRRVETQRAAIEATVQWFDVTMPPRVVVDLTHPEPLLALQTGAIARRSMIGRRARSGAGTAGRSHRPEPSRGRRGYRTDD